MFLNRESSKKKKEQNAFQFKLVNGKMNRQEQKLLGTNYYQWKLSIIYKIIILILHSMNCGMLIFPFHHGGQQKAGLRAGTENMSGIVGTACQIRFPVSLTQLCSISE